jgi:hypothetical protein
MSSEEVKESTVLSSQEVLEAFVKHCKSNDVKEFDEKEWHRFLQEHISYIPYSQFTRLSSTKKITEYINLHLQE